MSAPAEAPPSSGRTPPLDEPPKELLFRRRIRPLAAARELWQARSLIRALAERELRSRYKQTIIGVGWAVITPVTFMVVFTVFFQRVAKVDTQGAPYPVFSYVGLLPWTFFSSSVSRGGLSLVANLSLLNKVYCPREVFPIGSVIVAAIDTATALIGLVLLFAITQYAPRPESIYLPLMVYVVAAFTLGVTLIVSVLTVYFRDLRQAIPIILPLGLFATPVAFSITAIPSWARPLYAVFNPLAPAIDGLRRTVLFGMPPAWNLLGLGAISATVVLIVGFLVFKRMEAGVADVA
ncbi:MAG: ABC transporter permease [Acidimicrobiales bacterium]